MVEEGYTKFIKTIKQSRSADTHTKYQWMLEKFNDSLKDSGKTLDSFNNEDVMDFLAVKGESWSPRTKNLFLAIIKSFSNFCLLHIEPGADPAEIRAAMKEQQRLKTLMTFPLERVSRVMKEKALTVAELQTLLETAKSSCRPQAWMKIWLMFYLGTRKRELMALTPDRIDLETGRVVILTEKTLAERVLFVEPRVTLPILKSLCAGDFQIAGNVDTLNKMLMRLPSDLDRNVTPHTARHTFITNMRPCLKDDILVKLLVGHTQGGDMTSVYTSYREEDIRKAMIDQHYMKPLISTAGRWIR